MPVRRQYLPKVCDIALMRYDDDSISQQNIVQDDWILLCQLNSHYTVSCSQTASDDFDWAQDARALLPEQLRESVSWIKSHRTASQSDSTWHHQLPPVDTSTLMPRCQESSGIQQLNVVTSQSAY